MIQSVSSTIAYENKHNELKLYFGISKIYVVHDMDDYDIETGRVIDSCHLSNFNRTIFGREGIAIDDIKKMMNK